MITITISTPSDFNFHATVTSHGWYQLAPNHYDTEKMILHRPYQLENGKIVTLQITGGKSRSLIIEVNGQAIISSRDRNNIMCLAENMFSLKQNLNHFYAQMSKTVGYEWIAEKQTGRLLASPTVWEDLAKTVLTTNTSWANTVKMTEKLSAIDDNNIFPSPEKIISLSEEEFSDLAGAGYRNAYLYQAAQGIVSGEVDAENWRSLDSDTLYKTVRGLKGLGDYAAGTMTRLLGHFDKLAIDSVARTAYGNLTGHPPENDAEIREYYEKFTDWRGLVLWMDCIRDKIEETSN